MSGNFSAPITPERLETLTMVPPALIRRRAARLQRKAARSVLFSWRSQSTAESSLRGFFSSSAALLTSVSREARSAKAFST